MRFFIHRPRVVVARVAQHRAARGTSNLDVGEGRGERRGREEEEEEEEAEEEEKKKKKKKKRRKKKKKK